MINIVLPIAGRGSRFANVGYRLPKPLIDVHGQPMIQAVVNNIRPKCDHHFIFLALQDHLDDLGLREILNEIAPGCSIVPVDKVTEGPACTVLLARELIDNKDQLMIANSDQWVDLDINDYINVLKEESLDGLIMTMWADDPKWSFVEMDNEKVIRVVEKEVISNEATVGIYNFKRGSDFVRAADAMIAKNLRVNNEFYVAPVYNELIVNKSNIAVYNIGKEFDGMYGLGIPTDLTKFLSNSISDRLKNKS